MKLIYISASTLIIFILSSCCNKFSQKINEPLSITLNQPDSLYFGGGEMGNCERLYSFKIVNSSPNDLLLYFNPNVSYFTTTLKEDYFVGCFELIAYDEYRNILDGMLTNPGFMGEDFINDPMFNDEILDKYIHIISAFDTLNLQMKMGPILSAYASQCYLFQPEKATDVLLFISHLEKHINKQYSKQSIKKLKSYKTKIWDGILRVSIPVSHNCTN